MSDTVKRFELLICMVKEFKHVDEILAGFLELGITGATVVDARGMGEIITQDIPVFGGLRSLFPRGDLHTYMIISLIEIEALDGIADLVEDVCGDLNLPGNGVIFTLPTSNVRGFPKTPIQS